MDPAQIMSLLSSFFKLTFGHQIDLESYYTCLEVWCTFLEYLAMRNIDHIKQLSNKRRGVVFTPIRDVYDIRVLHCTD